MFHGVASLVVVLHPSSGKASTFGNFTRFLGLKITTLLCTVLNRGCGRGMSCWIAWGSREMGDSILNSMRRSLQSADQLLGDVDSSALAQVIDSGDRVLAIEGDADKDAADTLEYHKVGPLTDDTMMHIPGSNSQGTSVIAPVSSVEPKEMSSSIKVEPYKLSWRLDYASYLIHLAIFGVFGVFTRYGLQKLFGPGCLALTSDQSPLYLDLPSNMDTWEALLPSVGGTKKWLACLPGMFIVNESITVGAETGERL